ncbi:MAG: S1-C subfamily serine protease [Kiritimatiellia bacterium]|jgi:S1-C subfamily serine protease
MRKLTALTILLVLAACFEPSEALINSSLASPPVAAEAHVTAAVPAPSPSALIEDERNTIAIFDAAADATVFVTQKRAVNAWGSPREVPSGAGTGFVWDTNGHIVTNFHVVNGGRSFTVTMHDGTEYSATLVGGEPRKDIAVLRIDAPTDSLTAIRLPTEGAVPRVGQKAIAIGNPFGLDSTLTVGVISAMERDMEGFGGVTIRGMIQTDASINPGNSGGPLLDSSGQLVGMNTMIFSKSGGSAGIGFAVPTKHIRRVVPQLIATGQPRRVGLGVSLIQDQIARRAGIEGVVIRSVSAGSPASDVGLRGLRQTDQGTEIGDVITSIDGHKVSNFDQLYNALDPHEPGDSVMVGVRRDGEIIDVKIQIYVLNPGPSVR